MSRLADLVASKGFSEYSPEVQTQLQNLAIQFDNFDLQLKSLGNIVFHRWEEGFDENKKRQYIFYSDQLIVIDQAMSNVVFNYRIDNLKISTVSGTQLTPTQMDTIKSKLKTAIRAVLAGNDNSAKGDLESLLRGGIEVELETTNEYSQYKYVGISVIRLNTNYALNTLNEKTFGTAIKEIYSSIYD